jgi:hypothetical protein
VLLELLQMSDDNPTVSNGPNRDQRGRFGRGNSGGPGNPNVRKLATWRQTFDAAVQPADLRKVIKQLVGAAKKCEPWAVKELLNRCLGVPSPTDILERVEALEETIFKEQAR